MIGRSIIWANHIHSLHLRNCSLAASILLLARAISNIKANGLMMFGISWIVPRVPVRLDHVSRRFDENGEHNDEGAIEEHIKFSNRLAKFDFLMYYKFGTRRVRVPNLFYFAKEIVLSWRRKCTNFKRRRSNCSI